MLTTSLPFLDEHTSLVAAEDDEVWRALLKVLDAGGSRTGVSLLAGLLGCADRTPSGPRPLAPGSSTPGFGVATAEPGREVALEGRPRFSSYALNSFIDRLDAGQVTTTGREPGHLPWRPRRRVRAAPQVVRPARTSSAVPALIGAARRRTTNVIDYPADSRFASTYQEAS